MRKRVGLVLAVCAVLGACDGADSPTARERSARPVAFQAQGEAMRVESEEEARLARFLQGIRTVGSIGLRLTSFESSDSRCSFEPTNSVKISYTASTRFEPREMTQQVSFPGSLTGRTLNVRGRAFQVGRRCVPVAEEVTPTGSDAGSGVPLPASGTRQDPRPEQPATKPAPTQKQPAPVGVPEVAPVEPPVLPPPAPVVSSTLRPSLPNPPPPA
jgi:hypothetical protein